VELWSVVLKHKIDTSDIQLIDDLVLEHAALFDRVPQYSGLKRPKHHFLSHLALHYTAFMVHQRQNKGYVGCGGPSRRNTCYQVFRGVHVLRSIEILPR
jgi:hypothetical protein